MFWHSTLLDKLWADYRNFFEINTKLNYTRLENFILSHFFNVWEIDKKTFTGETSFGTSLVFLCYQVTNEQKKINNIAYRKRAQNQILCRWMKIPFGLPVCWKRQHLRWRNLMSIHRHRQRLVRGVYMSRVHISRILMPIVERVDVCKQKKKRRMIRKYSH